MPAVADQPEEKPKSFKQRREEKLGDTLNGASGPVDSAHEHSDNPPSPDEAPKNTKPNDNESEK